MEAWYNSKVTRNIRLRILHYLAGSKPTVLRRCTKIRLARPLQQKPAKISYHILQDDAAFSLSPMHSVIFIGILKYIHKTMLLDLLFWNLFDKLCDLFTLLVSCSEYPRDKPFLLKVFWAHNWLEKNDLLKKIFFSVDGNGNISIYPFWDRMDGSDKSEKKFGTWYKISKHLSFYGLSFFSNWKGLKSDIYPLLPEK